MVSEGLGVVVRSFIVLLYVVKKVERIFCSRVFRSFRVVSLWEGREGE